MPRESQPDDDANLGGDYARDSHRGGFGDDYAHDNAAAQKAEKSDDEESVDIGKASQ